MELKGQHTAVFGMKGEGKSNWMQYVLTRQAYQSHLMYDVTHEHEALNRYLPDHRRGQEAKDELQVVTERMVLDVDSDRRPELFAIDEFSRFCSTNSPPPEAVYELIDMNRHYGVGLILAARRPAQVHPDTFELADNAVFFYMDGDNDIRKLNRWRSGLGDAVSELPPYHFIVASGREWSVHSPVREMDTTGSL